METTTTSSSKPTAATIGATTRTTFPGQLHHLLSELEQDGRSDIASWQPNGRCFKVHKRQEFVQTIIPRWFRHTKLTSFQRQLSLYGFTRICAGPDYGSYYHEMFLRGQPAMAKTIRIDRTSWGGSQRDNRQNQIAALPPNHSIPIVAVMATATDHSSQVSNEWSNDATCNGKSAIEATRTSGQFNPMLPPPRRLLLTVPQPMTINPSVSANAFEAFLVKPHVPTPASSSSVPVNVFELPEHGTRVREQQIQPEMESLRLLAERFAQTRLDFQVSSFPSVTASLLPQPQYEQALLRAMQAPTIEPTQLPSQSSVHSSLPSGNQMFIRQLDGLQVRATEEQASQATPQWPAGAAMASQEQERATATLIRAFAIPQTQEHQAPCQNFSPGAMVTGLPINAQRDQPYTQALQNRSLQAPYWPKGPTAPRTAPWSQAQTPIPQNSSHPASIVATQAPAPSTSQELDAVTIRRHINTLLQSLANQG